MNDLDTRTAAFFDLDRTLLDMNSSTLWAKHELRGGSISVRQFGRVVVWNLLYHLSLIDIETAFKEAIAAIEAGKEIAKENADVLSTALREAKIDIVGGEAHFFDTFAKSLSIGKAIDGLANKSETITALVDKFLPAATAPAEPVRDEPSD